MREQGRRACPGDLGWDGVAGSIGVGGLHGVHVDVAGCACTRLEGDGASGQGQERSEDEGGHLGHADGNKWLRVSIVA